MKEVDIYTELQQYGALYRMGLLTTDFVKREAMRLIEDQSDLKKYLRLLNIK